MIRDWRMAPVHISQDLGITAALGLTYRGIGLYFDREAENFDVLHLGSGHRLASIRGRDRALAKELAGQIADLGDWTFDGLDGWRNSDPQIIDRLRALMAKHPDEIIQHPANQSPQGAQRVAQERAG